MNNTFAEIQKQTKSAKISAEAAKSAAETARLSLETDQRAWVGITKFEGADFTATTGSVTRAVYVKEGEDIRIGADLNNSGKSIAKNLAGCVRWDSAPSNKPFVPTCASSEHGQAVVQPGVTVTFWSQGPDGFKASAELIKALRNGDVRLYVHGYLTYRDIFKASHYIKFCVVLTRDLTAFGAYGDREYNDAN
jgi:hypothetical protein